MEHNGDHRVKHPVGSQQQPNPFTDFDLVCIGKPPNNGGLYIPILTEKGIEHMRSFYRTDASNEALEIYLEKHGYSTEHVGVLMNAIQNSADRLIH